MIKLANINDLDQIMVVVSDAVSFLKNNKVPQWQNNYPNKDIIIRDIKAKTFYVYKEDNIIKGIINISNKEDPQYNKIYQGSWLTNNKYLVIHRLAVKEEYLGTGLATKLLEFAQELALKQNIYSIRIDTHKSNIAMNNLLTKMHYQYCGIIELDNTDQEDYRRNAYELSIKSQ